MFRSLQPIGRIAAALAVGSTILLAQGSQTAELSGEIKDGKGLGLANARIVLSSPALQGVRSYATDANGKFSARLLPPGQYQVLITKDGFQALRVNQKLSLGQSYSPRYTLQPVGVATVEVVASLAQLDKTSVVSNMDFQMDKMEDLPMNRNPEAMLALTPGVVENQGSTATGFAQIRGAMTNGNLYLIDGQNVNDNVYGNRGVSVIDDAIQEIQVITGAIPADYGDVDGGVINTITKSGGNEFSGTFRIEGQNQGWNAVSPHQDRTTIPSKFIYDTRASVGGYLVKDKFWFFISGFQSSTTIDPSNPTDTITSGAYTGQTYPYKETDKRLQARLTYLVNQDHTLSFSLATHHDMANGVGYSAGDQASFGNQLNQDSIWSLTWQANWTPWLSMELRTGIKNIGLTGGGLQQGISPVYDQNAGVRYYNGIFNNYDGGDHRNSKNVDVKFTAMFEGAGTHEMSFGANVLDGSHRAQNQQSPTQITITAEGVNPQDAVNTTQNPLYALFWASSPVTAYDNSLGVFVNDKWSVDKNLSLNVGLRYDKYHAYSGDTNASAGMTGWSPRLGVKWDVLGDSKWQVGLSFCRYNASPLTVILNSVSAAGNPTVGLNVYDAGIPGAAPNANGYYSLAQIQNPANWDIPILYQSPATTQLSNSLSSPYTSEYQLTLTHGFRLMDREAYVKATLVNKNFSNLLDYTIGNSGMMTPTGVYAQYGPQFIKQWENQPLAKRVYRDAELESGWAGDHLEINGNITWSVLEGNYQGEQSGYGPTGQGLLNYTTVNGTKEYNWQDYNPYGPLVGDTPLRIRMSAAYHWDWAWGKTTLGLIYKFDSGQHQSITRTINDASQVNPDLGNYPAIENAVTFLQYQNNQMGALIYPSQAYTDFTVQQDFKTLKAAGKVVKTFVKLDFFNVFNHQQQISYQNYWQSVPSTGQGGSVNSPWINSGYPLGPSNYGSPRQIKLEAGFKF
jgi:outer membrane receptor for ferrienterochelin and colicin